MFPLYLLHKSLDALSGFLPASSLYASAPATALARCPSVCPIMVDMIAKEHLLGMSSNLAKTSAWTRVDF